MIALACLAALALLWGRVVALRFGWPTWLVAVSLGAFAANLAAHTGWHGWGHPTLSLASLGLAALAISQLSPVASDAPPAKPRRPHVWWGTLGAGSAVAAITAPVLWPLALLIIIWCAWRLRAGSPLARWGLSAFVVTSLVGLGYLHYSGWPVVAPTFALPPWPTSAAAATVLDLIGPIAAVLALIGVAVAWLTVPWISLGGTASLLVLSPVPWRAPWPQSWPWAVACGLAVVIGLGWLASRPKRPSLRIALWLALGFAALTPPLAAWVL